MVGYTTNCFKASFGEIPTYTFAMKARDLVTIRYVSRRGVDEVEGAIQRLLNPSRIEKIKNYLLKGNIFFNSFILNWTEDRTPPIFNNGNISFVVSPFSAQVIDGQHRIEGIAAAMAEDASVGERELIVTLCIGLTTEQAAKVFLNINTEQKPVPKSLIYDLFGLTENDPNIGINRARDIADNLNQNQESPLFKRIRFPGDKAIKGVSTIDLSTFVSVLQKELEQDGVFSKYKIDTLEKQASVINNFFVAIQAYYKKLGYWDLVTKNPFLKASGFNGAVDFLVSSLIKECATHKSFSTNTMAKIINFDRVGPITLEEIKNMDGKTARKRVSEHLELNLVNQITNQDDYEY